MTNRGIDVLGKGGKGSVNVKTMVRRKYALMEGWMDEGEKKNAGCRSEAAGSNGFRRAHCLWDLIASASLLEVLTVACLGGSQSWPVGSACGWEGCARLSCISVFHFDINF